MVGMLMRQRQRNMAWYKNFPAEPEVVAGEAIKNVNHWRALLATADDTSTGLSALSNATVIGSVAPNHRSVSEVAASRHSVAPALQHWTVPGALSYPNYGAPTRKDPSGGTGARKNPLGVDGPIFVGNRCAKCGHEEHPPLDPIDPAVVGSVQLNALWQSASDRNPSLLTESIGVLLDDQKSLLRQSILDSAPVEPSRCGVVGKDYVEHFSPWSVVVWCGSRNKEYVSCLVPFADGRCAPSAVSGAIAAHVALAPLAPPQTLLASPLPQQPNAGLRERGVELPFFPLWRRVGHIQYMSTRPKIIISYITRVIIYV
jgi:hypothetical protein